MPLFPIKSTDARRPIPAIAHMPSTVHRALVVPEIRESIFAYCRKDYTNLRAVNHDFADSLNTPHIWRDEFAPAEVIWPSRTIYTAVVPDSGPEPKANKFEKRSGKFRVLGTYRGESWTLKAGVPPRRRNSDITEEALNQVALMTAVARLGIVPMSDQDRQIHRRAGQERAYDFLLDRAFRLKSGLPIATYRKEVPQFLALFSAFLGAQYLFFSGVQQLDPERVQGWAQLRNAAVIMAASLVWVPASLAMLFVLFLRFGDDRTLTNMFMGPFQKRKLDAWAIQVSLAQKSREGFESREEINA